MRIDRMIDTLQYLRLNSPAADIGLVKEVREDGIVICVNFAMRAEGDLIYLATDEDDAKIDQFAKEHDK